MHTFIMLFLLEHAKIWILVIILWPSNKSHAEHNYQTTKHSLSGTDLNYFNNVGSQQSAMRKILPYRLTAINRVGTQISILYLIFKPSQCLVWVTEFLANLLNKLQ